MNTLPHYDWAFDPAGNPERFAFDRVLQDEVGRWIEANTPRTGITITHLSERFGSVLDRASIHVAAPNDARIKVLLETTGDYVALTNEGRFQSLLPRLTGLSLILQSVVTTPAP
jgi:hypothetical protein